MFVFDADKFRGNKDQCMFLIYLEAVSVSNNKGTFVNHVCVFSFKCNLNDMGEIFFILFIRPSNKVLFDL